MRIGLISISLVLVNSTACKQEAKEETVVEVAAPAAACPAKFSELPNPAGEVSCSCAAGVAAGAVWGSGTYTTDSAICAAALHAGAVTAAGGVVKMKVTPGCSAYEGSQKNGVVTAPWGSFGGSFHFVGLGSGQCFTPPEGACPANFKSIPNVSETTELECNCSASQFAGSLWGTGIYTRDSSICQAALHAGGVTTAGGKVKVKAAPGCSSYKGSAQNGATSGNWDSYDGSFYVVGHGDGQCEALAKDACPASFGQIPGVSDATEHSCTCAPTQLRGSVWGNAIYTRDSSICQAAQHAGVISQAGGSVKAKAAPGCPSYAGTTQNGVTTAPWQSFAGSFFFPGKGTGKCK